MSAATKTVMALVLVLTSCAQIEERSSEQEGYAVTWESVGGVTNRLWEVRQSERVSVVHWFRKRFNVEDEEYACYLIHTGRLCDERGFQYYVLLTGTFERAYRNEPGRFETTTIGFLNDPDANLRTEFPTYLADGDLPPVYPVDPKEAWERWHRWSGFHDVPDFPGDDCPITKTAGDVIDDG